jgi:hypothetical protein
MADDLNDPNTVLTDFLALSPEQMQLAVRMAQAVTPEQAKAMLNWPLAGNDRGVFDPHDASYQGMQKVLTHLTGHADPYMAFNETMRVSAGALPIHQREGGVYEIGLGLRPQPQIGKGDKAVKLASLASSFLPLWEGDGEKGIPPGCVSHTIKMVQERLGLDLSQMQFIPFFPQMKKRYDMANQKHCVGEVHTFPLFITTPEKENLPAVQPPLVGRLWLSCDELDEALNSYPHELDESEIDLLYFMLNNAKKLDHLPKP